jgi:hypothetical protein
MIPLIFQSLERPIERRKRSPPLSIGKTERGLGLFVSFAALFAALARFRAVAGLASAVLRFALLAIRHALLATRAFPDFSMIMGIGKGHR